MSFKHLFGYYKQGRRKKVKMGANEQRWAQMNRDGHKHAEMDANKQRWTQTSRREAMSAICANEHK